MAHMLFWQPMPLEQLFKYVKRIKRRYVLVIKGKYYFHE